MELDTKNPADLNIIADLKGLIPTITQLGLRPEDIHDNAHLYNDCGLDSISLIEFLVAIENRYGFSMAAEDFDPETITNLNVLAEYIRSKMPMETKANTVE